MVILLDTHILLWWLNDDKRLKKAERQRIASLDTIVYVSAVSAWEIEIKRGLGRIHLPDDWPTHVEQQGFLWLPISWKHTRQLSSLPDIHRDPFDRMLVAQAKAEQITLISYDVDPSKADEPSAYDGVREFSGTVEGPCDLSSNARHMEGYGK